MHGGNDDKAIGVRRQPDVAEKPPPETEDAYYTREADLYKRMGAGLKLHRVSKSAALARWRAEMVHSARPK